MTCPLGNACNGVYGDLEAHRDLVKRLYAEDNFTLEDVMEILRTEHGVQASCPMYKKKFRKWNLRKKPDGEPRFIMEHIKYQRQKPKIAANGCGSKDMSKAISGLYRCQSQETETHMTLQADFLCSCVTAASRGKAFSITQLSEYLQSQTLRIVSSPASLKVIEEMAFAIQTHVSRRLEPRLQSDRPMASWKVVPISQRLRLEASNSLQVFALAIETALSLLGNGSISMAVASLEQAFQRMEDFVRHDHFSTIMTILGTIVDLFTADRFNIAPIILKQLFNMVSVVWGSHTPLAIWAKCSLSLVDFEEAWITASYDIFAHTVENVLGPDDPYTLMTQSHQYRNHYLIHNHRHDTVALEGLAEKMKALIRGFPDTAPGASRFRDNIAQSYGVLMFEVGQYEQAETIYFNESPVRLEAQLADATFSRDHIVRDMTLYGRILTCRGNYEAAGPVFSQAVSLSSEHLGPSAPETLDAIYHFGQCLALQNLTENAKAMYAELDERLAPYMLKTSDMEMEFL